MYDLNDEFVYLQMIHIQEMVASTIGHIIRFSIYIEFTNVLYNFIKKKTIN